jgi:putative YhbY family RNA-binding protein
MNDPRPTPYLSPVERKALKARAHHLNPVVMIGESGLTEAVLAEIERALSTHELIKVRVFGDDREARAAIMQRACEALGAAPVQSIGKLLVIWRPGDESAGAQTGKGAPKRPRGPRVPKKAAGEGKKTVSRKPRGTEAARARASAEKTAGSGKKVGYGAKAGLGAKPATRSRPAGKAGARPGPGAGPGRAPAPAAGRPARPGTGGAAAGVGKAGTRSSRTAGKRTDLSAGVKEAPRRGRASSATQGPTHLQGKPGPRTAGPRGRGRKGG